MRKSLILGAVLLAAAGALAAPTVVQSAQCSGTTSPLTCTFSSSVTNGNYIFTMVAGGNTFAPNSSDCITGSGAYADTRSTSFIRVIGENNTNGFGSGVCIMWGQLGSSGADSVSYTFGGTPAAMNMYVIEVSGIPSPSLDAFGVNNPNFASSVPVSATATTANSFTVCAASNNNAATYTAGTPGTFTAGSTGGFIYATTGSGLTTCTFTLSAGGQREAAAIGIIKFSGPSNSKRRMSQVY